MIATRFVGMILAAFLSGALPGCSCDPEEPGGTGAAGVSGDEKEAQDAVLAAIGDRWLKVDDGWITARDSGSSFAPIPYLRQVRDISVQGVTSFDLSDADKMNGFEWAGEVTFKQTPCREVGEQGVVLEGLANQMIYRQKGQWSQWLDFKPEAVPVAKQNGKWRVDTDTWMLRGTKPADQDFANARVSR